MENQQQSYSKKYQKGMIIGPLELLEEYKEELKWLVRCLNCNAEFKIVRSDLHKYVDKDKCKNCGLILESRTYPNGSIYGNIKIIKFLGETTKRERFLLECLNCGRQFEVSRSTMLKYATDKSEYCSYCKPFKHNSTKYKEGEILGNCYRLTKFLGGYLWEVECTHCGKKYQQSIGNMKKHKKDTCFYCEHPYSDKAAFGRTRQDLALDISERIYSYYKGNILDKNLKNPTKKQKPFELTFEQFKNLIYSDCYYCGAAPSEDNVWNKSGKRKIDSEPVRVNGIDRIDSNKGYTIENCVPCCPQCNRIKLDYTTELFLKKVKEIYCKMFNDQSKDVAPSGCEMEGSLCESIKDEDMVSSAL